MPATGAIGIPLIKSGCNCGGGPGPGPPANVLRDEDGNPLKDEDGNWLLAE